MNLSSFNNDCLGPMISFSYSLFLEFSKNLKVNIYFIIEKSYSVFKSTSTFFFYYVIFTNYLIHLLSKGM
jgi:hypothetical protein